MCLKNELIRFDSLCSLALLRIQKHMKSFEL